MQRLLMRLAGFAVHVFYRVRRLGGEVPARGPVLLVGNHPNGLVDPVLLAGVTPRPVRFLGKAPLFDMPVLGSVMRGVRALPVYRTQEADPTLNEDTFSAVHAALRAGDLVCIFPEGRSHSEPVIQRLKTGAARMALGAEREAGFELGVRIVPVGLVYRAKRRFRSRVATWVGRPIDAREVQALHAHDDREAVRVLTERIAEGLREVTLCLDRWEDLPLLELAERIWRPEEGDRLERIHRFAEGVRRLRAHDEEDAQRVDRLSDRISAFRERLRRIGLSVDDLALQYDAPVVLRYGLRSLGVSALALPLALAGGLFWLVPYLLAPWIARVLRPTRDTYATVQILAGIVFFPAWWAAVAIAIGILGGWTAAGIVATAALPVGLVALWFRDWRRERMADVAAFLVLTRRTRLRQLLRKERDEIAREIEALRAELARVG